MPGAVVGGLLPHRTDDGKPQHPDEVIHRGKHPDHIPGKQVGVGGDGFAGGGQRKQQGPQGLEKGALCRLHRLGLLPFPAGGFPVGLPADCGGFGLHFLFLTGSLLLFQPQGGGFGFQLPDGFLASQQVFEGHIASPFRFILLGRSLQGAGSGGAAPAAAGG